MSLEELMKTPGASSPWKGQRIKLLRLLTGLGIAAVALIGGIILLASFKTSHADDAEARSLAELLRIQKETTELKRQIAAAPETDREPVRGGGRRYAGARAGVQVVNYEPGDGFATLTTAKSDVYIPTGAVFQAQLLTPIKTSVEKTFLMAETTNEFRMDNKRKIPRGSRLIGRSHFDPVLKGVVVEFDTVVFPDGIETTIAGLALSRNALPEIDGLYFSDKMVNYGTAIAFGFLSGFADAARERDVTLLGSQPRVSMSNQVLSGLSTASFQVANEILRDIRANAIEYVVVPAGEQVFVVLTRRYNINQGGAS